ANSNGLTPHMAAAGMSAQGTTVPPPIQIAATWPSAVSIAPPLPMAAENMPATEPTSEIPENPDPSRPVIAPTTVNVTAAIPELIGTTSASATPRSFTIPCEPSGNPLWNNAVNAESPR